MADECEIPLNPRAAAGVLMEMAENDVAKAKALLKQLSDAADYDEYNQPYLPESSALPLLLAYAEEIRQEGEAEHVNAELAALRRLAERLEWPLAQLRHAYLQAVHGNVTNQHAYARGLLARPIERIEEVHRALVGEAPRSA